MAKVKLEDTLPGVPVGPSVEEFCVKAVFDDDGVQVSSSIGKDGREYGDPVPMEPPVGYKAPPDLMEMIRSMVQAESFRSAADAAGVDSFEEGDDFDIEDDPLDPATIHERYFEAKADAAAKKAEATKQAALDAIAKHVAAEKAAVEAAKPAATLSSPAPPPVVKSDAQSST